MKGWMIALLLATAWFLVALHSARNHPPQRTTPPACVADDSCPAGPEQGPDDGPYYGPMR